MVFFFLNFFAQKIVCGHCHISKSNCVCAEEETKVLLIFLFVFGRDSDDDESLSPVTPV